MTDVRTALTTLGNWAVTNKGLFEYLESRPFPLYLPSAERHIANDCSATVTLLYWLAGAGDPNGMGFDGWGNTTSLAEKGREVTVDELLPGDLVVYYSPEGFLPGNSVHTAMVIQPSADPLTVSHGQASEPAYVRVSQDGRPHKFFRFDTTLLYPAHRAPFLAKVTTPAKVVAKAAVIRKAIGHTFLRRA